MHTELLVRLTNRNKTESDPYDDIIKNYKELNYKCRSLKERLELIERENNSLKRISGDPALMNELQIRIQSLEKELTDSMRDNNLKSTKLCEILTDKMLMKDQLDNLTNQNATKSSRILELESIVRAQDDQINKLNDDVSYLKAENGKLERLNITLNDNLNKKLVENTLLTNEVLKVKGDFVEKMNEMNDLLEAARKKKVAAEIYFDEKKTEYKRGNNEVNILSSIKDYQIQFEDVIIPKTLKLKFSAHRKALTSLKFNGFGTNFITTGGDNFVKLWDASKSNYIH